MTTASIISSCETAFSVPAGSILGKSMLRRIAHARACAGVLAMHRRNGRKLWEVAADFGSPVEDKYQRHTAAQRMSNWKTRCEKYVQYQEFQESIIRACQILNAAGKT